MFNIIALFCSVWESQTTGLNSKEGVKLCYYFAGPAAVIQFTEYFKIMKCASCILIVFPPHLLSSITAAHDKIVLETQIYNINVTVSLVNVSQIVCLQICYQSALPNLEAALSPGFQLQLHPDHFCLPFFFFLNCSAEHSAQFVTALR